MLQAERLPLPAPHDSSCGCEDWGALAEPPLCFPLLHWGLQEVLRQQLHLEACLLAGMKGQLLPPSLPPLQAASTLSPVRSQGGRSEGSSSSCSEILDIEDDEDCAAGGPAPSHRDGACSGRRTGAAGSRVEECQKEGWERQLSSQAEALSTQVGAEVGRLA